MNFIVAVDENYAIGNKGKLLTHLPEDLKYFKEKTLNKVVVMGRKTLESFPRGKPLKNRKNIVLTRQADYYNDGAIVVHSLDDLFKELRQYNSDEIFIIGGAEIYQALLPYCRYGYITKIQEHFPADQYLEKVENISNWHLSWQSEEKEYFGLKFRFTQYENYAVQKV